MLPVKIVKGQIDEWISSDIDFGQTIYLFLFNKIKTYFESINYWDQFELLKFISIVLFLLNNNQN